MTKAIKNDWKNPDQTAEVIYERQSEEASKGKRVVERPVHVEQGPIPQPDF